MKGVGVERLCLRDWDSSSKVFLLLSTKPFLCSRMVAMAWLPPMKSGCEVLMCASSHLTRFDTISSVGLRQSSMYDWTAALMLF